MIFLYSKKNPFLVTNFLLFVFFYLYICLRIDPRLLYHKSPELFLIDIEFFKPFLIYPGGITDLISKFFLEFYYFGYLGAFVITALTFLLCLSFSRFVENIIGKSDAGRVFKVGKILFFIPAFFILISHNRYSAVSLVGLLLALLFVNLYTKLYLRHSGLRVSLYILLSIFMYYLAAYSYLLFAGLCAMWEILKNRRYILGYLFLGIEILIFFVASEYMFYLPRRNVLYYIFPFFSSPDLKIKLSVLALLISLLVAAAFKLKSKKTVFVLPVWVLVCFQFWNEVLLNKILYGFFLTMPLILTLADKMDYSKLRQISLKYSRVFFVFLIILSLSILTFTFDKETNLLLKINYFSQVNLWEDVLREAKKVSFKSYLSGEDRSLYQMIFKALYHTNRLPYEQFDYPASLLFNMPFPRPNSELMRLVRPIEISDTCFRLGLINHAELMSSRAMQIQHGEPARATKQLSLIYILKGHKAAAKVILNRLKKSFLYHAWAKKHLKLLRHPDMLSEDLCLAQAKQNMIAADSRYDEPLLIQLAGQYEYNYEEVFKRLLSENKNNRMAFEYLMSFYLLIGQTGKILANISRLDDFDYADIPYNYQEAILVNMFETKNMNPGLGGRRLSQEVVEKYRYFYSVYRKYSYNRTATYNALKGAHGNSYFLYYIMPAPYKKDETRKN